jgi:hypothetical protein
VLHRSLTTAAAAALVLGLAACGGSSPEADPTLASAASSGSTGTPSDEPPPTTSSVAPATGVRVDTSRFSFRAPEGFENRSISGELIGSVVDLAPDDSIFFSIFEDYRPATLDELAQAYLDSSSYQKLPKRMPDTEIDGMPVFHLSGPVSDRSYADAYGLVIDGAGVNITFEVHSDATRRQEIIDSTLQTLRWK